VNSKKIRQALKGRKQKVTQLANVILNNLLQGKNLPTGVQT